jgi:hypothetical protein
MLDSSVYQLVYHARRGAMFSSISSGTAERRGAGDDLSPITNMPGTRPGMRELTTLAAAIT